MSPQRKEYIRQWRFENQARIQATSKAWAKRNRVKINAASCRWARRHRDYRRRYEREWRRRNPLRVAAYDLKYLASRGSLFPTMVPWDEARLNPMCESPMTPLEILMMKEELVTER